MLKNSPAPGDTQGESGEPLHILLAEDDVVSQQVAQLMLARLGHRVDAVSNGLDAVDAVRRAAYDAVLMDVQMPGLNGLGATERIRAELPAGRRLIIIAVTADSSVELQAACVAAGMDAHLTKPLRAQALRAVLATVRGRPGNEGDSRTPSETSASALPAYLSADGREAAVRTRLTELSSPDADDEELLAALLTSFVSRTPDLLDQLERAVSEGSSQEVERVAHAFAGASENLGCVGLARALRHVEARSRAGELPAAAALLQVRNEQSMLRPILRSIAGQMQTPLAGRAVH